MPGDTCTSEYKYPQRKIYWLEKPHFYLARKFYYSGKYVMCVSMITHKILVNIKMNQFLTMLRSTPPKLWQPWCSWSCTFTKFHLAPAYWAIKHLFIRAGQFWSHQVNYDIIYIYIYMRKSGSVWVPVSTSELTDFQKTWHEHYAINGGNPSVALFDILQGAVAYQGGRVLTPPQIPKALLDHAKLNPIVKTVKNCWI